MGWKRNGIRACRRTCGDDRARLNAREGSGALSAGQAGKMAVRWHELVEAREKGPESHYKMREGRASSPMEGRLGSPENFQGKIG